MAVPIIVPWPQFCDADGEPLAGGTVETYVPGTSTPKQVWIDPDGLAFQTNPIVLNAAGRCLWYGSGEYRLVLRTAAGDLVWDALSTTIVSTAMEPVVEAPTIEDAVEELGIPDLIATAVAAEASVRAAADTTLQTNINNEAAARAAADALLAPLASPTFTGDPKAPTASPGDNDTSLATTAFVTAAIAAALAGLGGGAVTGPVQTRSGMVTSTPSGTFTVTFSTPFPTKCLTLTGHGVSAFPELYYLELVDLSGYPLLPTTTGASGTAYQTLGGGSPPTPTPAPSVAFAYVATGY